MLALTFVTGDKSAHRQKPTGLAAEVVRQLEAYRRNPAFHFDLPLAPSDTGFQDRVRRALQHIPPGATVSYGELARDIASGPRAVGNALKRNPFPLVIPCHRVTAKRGLGGYGGAVDGPMLTIKRGLLAHEASVYQALE